MFGFVGGLIVGVVVCFLVLNNNPSLMAKLGSVKKLVEEKVQEVVNKK